MYSRKHYTAVAKIIHQIYSDIQNSEVAQFPEHEEALEAVDKAVDSLGDFFAQYNPHFDKNKFEWLCIRGEEEL